MIICHSKNMVARPNCSSQRKERTRQHAEGGQRLGESVAIGTFEALADVSQQLIEGLVQLCLICQVLRAHQVVLVGCETGLAREHETEHRPHDRPVILGGTKQ